MRKTNVVDYTIEIDPYMGMYSSRSFLGDRYLKEKKAFAQEMIDQIHRHVDGSRHAAIIEQTEDVCEYCGADWTETSNMYNGGCCDEDQTKWEET